MNTESDRELLELAAKAAGIRAKSVGPQGLIRRIPDGKERKSPVHWPFWNPMNNDGDALRLAVKLGIEYGFGFNGNQTVQRIIIDDDLHVMVQNDDPYTATRRAIVRAAAEIGRTRNEH